MNTKHFYHKVVVITGGSSGIGLALAKEFATQQAQIILIARNQKKLELAREMLEQISGSNSMIQTIVSDVSIRDEITSVIDHIGQQFGKIDLVINCAGIITCGRFEDQKYEDLENCLNTNYFGALYISKAAWSWLKASKGQLSFVSSVAGYLGLIGYSGYAPSKFALTGLAECLRMEGKDDNIRVSIIYPPDTDTPLLQYERRHSLPESMALSKNIKIISPEKVAKIYIRALQKNQFSIYCDFNSRFVRLLKDNVPGLFNYLTERIIIKARRQAQLTDDFKHAVPHGID